MHTRFSIDLAQKLRTRPLSNAEPDRPLHSPASV